MMCDPLGHPARVDENQSSSMRLNQFGKPMIDFLPNFIRHHRLKRRFRNTDREIQFATMTDVNDVALRVTRLMPGRPGAEKTGPLFQSAVRPTTSRFAVADFPSARRSLAEGW